MKNFDPKYNDIPKTEIHIHLEGSIHTGTILDSGVVPCLKAGADTQAPTTPGGFTAAPSSATQVDLSWSAATDNTGVSGYTRIEKLGKPGVFICTDKFAHDAKSAAEDFGMPKARIVALPAADYYRLRATEKGIKIVADAALERILDALRRPLSAEEASATATKEVLKPVTVIADTYAHAMQKFNQIFLENHWGDGLPLLPPTKEEKPNERAAMQAVEENEEGASQ